MRIVVIGGSGLIGARFVERLRRDGQSVMAASRATGVDTMTGSGLSGAMDGAEIVIDVSNPPAAGHVSAPEFFTTSGRNIIGAAITAEVRHHVVLSVVGAERLRGSDYFRAKLLQEEIVSLAGFPYTIVRSTQFFEFMPVIAEAMGDGRNVRIPPTLIQPVAADDVAAALAQVATEPSAVGMLELAGPEALCLGDIVRQVIAAKGDARTVMIDPSAQYFGMPLGERTLMPGEMARIAPTTLDAWLAGRSASKDK